MKKRTLLKYIEGTLFEDVSYGLYDRPAYAGATKDDKSNPEFEPTIGTEVPLEPTALMANQLQYEKPPIEDENYVPTSIQDLQHAAATIAEHVPPGQIKYFYQKLHDLLDKAVEKENDVEIAADAEEDLDMPVGPVEPTNESFVKALSENIRPGDYTLQQIADELDYAAPSGARQFIERTLQKLQYFVQLPDSDIEKLISSALPEFKAYMQELIDHVGPGGGAEEFKDILSRPDQQLANLSSFRYFLVNAYIGPAWKQMIRVAANKAKDRLAELGVPKKAMTTFFNQVNGGTDRNPAKLAKKLDKVGVSPADRDKIVERVIAEFTKLQRMTAPEGNVVEIALNKYDSMSNTRRKKVFVDALQSVDISPASTPDSSPLPPSDDLSHREKNVLRYLRNFKAIGEKDVDKLLGGPGKAVELFNRRLADYKRLAGMDVESMETPAGLRFKLK